MRVTIAATAAALGLLLAPAAQAAETANDKEQFHLTMPHTKEQCLATLDRMAAKDDELFQKTDWGCRYGHHTGYVTVAAADEQAARAMVPEPDRANAKVQKVGKFTREDLEKIHKSKAAKK
jgi:hypothetical protein